MFKVRQRPGDEAQPALHAYSADFRVRQWRAFRVCNRHTPGTCSTSALCLKRTRSPDNRTLKETDRDVKGYDAVDVKCYCVDIKGYGVDVKSYGVDVRAMMWMLRVMTINIERDGQGRFGRPRIVCTCICISNVRTPREGTRRGNRRPDEEMTKRRSDQ
eukprot:9491321-Pyramimonas_sp.AAC.2